MLLRRPAFVAHPAWPLLGDALLAGLLLVAGQLEVAHPNPSSGFVGTAARPVSAVLAALIVLPLPWRRRAPAAVLCAVAALLALPHLFIDVSVPFVGGLVPLLVATYTAARRAPELLGRLALVVPFLALVVLTLTVPHFQVESEYLFAVPVFLAAWGTGQALRRWEAQSRRLAVALAELARTQEARTEAVVLDERARIARELHDVIAHSVSVMLLQSGSARLSLRRSPDRAEAALEVIESTGRQAMAEMRSLVGILRPRDPGTDPEAPPGVAALPGLQETMRRAGLDVTICVVGSPVTVPPGLDLSAYRIVQEALTNALKHAGRTSASAVVTYRPDCLHLTVSDDGPHGAVPPPAPGGGHGLVGMRERVALYRGHLQAGLRPEGGYLVDVEFPLETCS